MNVRAVICGIEYFLPAGSLSNEELALAFPDWSVDKIYQKTGIRSRAIASSEECSSDLGLAAAHKLFASSRCRPDAIDYLIFVTQSPDYFLPATACILHERLGLAKTAGAIDVNQGCSGYVYGLGLASALIDSGQARNVLLITGETYSKFIHPQDKSVRTLFGDAGSATLISATKMAEEHIWGFVYGSDGRGARHLIVPAGGLRKRFSGPETRDTSGNVRADGNLYMNGPEVLNFTLRAVPKLIADVLTKARLGPEEPDLYVLHQANRFMLESLTKKMKLPAEKVIQHFEGCGNTVSATIPIALKEAQKRGLLKRDALLLLAGFGVGYSWAGCMLRWAPMEC